MQKVSVEDLWFATSSPSFTGWVHEGCVPLADPEAVVARGPITRVDVYMYGGKGRINGIRLWYGRDGVGLAHGFSENIAPATWELPPGERITRVEGQIQHCYISRLQFFTDEDPARRCSAACPAPPGPSSPRTRPEEQCGPSPDTRI